MIKRSYFFKVESKPLLRQKRLDDRLATCWTGIVEHKSWFPNTSRVWTEIICLSMDVDDGTFKRDEIMITQLSRL
jgi:hypothetical protein